jgi:hypothetical protein
MRNVTTSARTSALLRYSGLLCALLALQSPHLLAIEDETIPSAMLRAQHRLSPATRVNLQYTARWQQSFEGQERSIAQASIATVRGLWQFSGAYNQHFDRAVPGKEHRLWQEAKYTFNRPSGSLESSARVEERYFPDWHDSGLRLRVLNSWTRPIDENDEWSVGHEWVMNLQDIGSGVQRGISQTRLIGGVLHRLGNGDAIELEYQWRYLHTSTGPNRVQHQIQLGYTLNF